MVWVKIAHLHISSLTFGFTLDTNNGLLAVQGMCYQSTQFPLGTFDTISPDGLLCCCNNDYIHQRSPLNKTLILVV